MRVRLTTDEYDALIERAKTAGMSLSRCIVEHALRDSGTILNTELSGYGLYTEREWAIFMVACAGTKLNKIAKRLNAQRGTIKLNDVEGALLETKTALECWQFCTGDSHTSGPFACCQRTSRCWSGQAGLKIDGGGRQHLGSSGSSPRESAWRGIAFRVMVRIELERAGAYRVYKDPTDLLVTETR